MAMMSCTYAAIGRELWGQRAIGEATAAQKEGIRSKRRVRYLKHMYFLLFVCNNCVSVIKYPPSIDHLF